MTSINHALTGSIIGLVVGQPLIAVPLAVVSHFVCDAIPHFGSSLPHGVYMKTRAFHNYLVLNAAACFLLVVCLAAYQPRHWLLAAVCAFAAAAPDFLSLNRYLKNKRDLQWQAGWYARFAHNIQWFERPIGAVVEVVWFAAAVAIIIPFLR
jgi:hypothetical protein